MEAIIVLVITGLAFLALLIYIIVELVRGPELPNGYRFEYVDNNNKAVVIVDNKLQNEEKNSKGEVVSWNIDGISYRGADLAKACALAITATETAFLDEAVQKADVSRVVFHFATDATFETGPLSIRGAAAYSISKAGIFGSNKTPLATIRTKYINSVIERGQPAVHELVHILNEAATGSYSTNHSDPALWLGPGGAASIEGAAAENFRKVKEGK